MTTAIAGDDNLITHPAAAWGDRNRSTPSHAITSAITISARH